MDEALRSCFEPPDAEGDLATRDEFSEVARSWLTDGHDAERDTSAQLKEPSGLRSVGQRRPGEPADLAAFIPTFGAQDRVTCQDRPAHHECCVEGRSSASCRRLQERIWAEKAVGVRGWDDHGRTCQQRLGGNVLCSLEVSLDGPTRTSTGLLPF